MKFLLSSSELLTEVGILRVATSVKGPLTEVVVLAEPLLSID